MITSKNEKYYKSIFTGVGGAISVIEVFEDARFRYLGVNPAFEDLIGMQSQEIEGKEPKDFVSLIGEKVIEEIIADFKQCLKTKKSLTSEHQIVLNNQERWYVRQLNPVCDQKGRVVRLIALIHDATKHKKTEEELRQVEDRYQRIVEMQTELILRHLPNGIITFVNESCCRYFGKPHHEFIGHNFFTLIAKLALKDEHKALKKKIKALTPDHPILEEDHQVHCADASIRWNRWVLRALFNEKKVVIEYQAVGRDIDDQKQAELALKKSEEKLREQKKALQHKNIALQELLEQVEVEKIKIKNNVVANVGGVLTPLIEKLKTKNVPRKYVALLKSAVEDVASSYGRRITNKSLKLSPRETEIANMIKNNLSSKEIANLLNISLETIERHRANIRKKLGLVNEDINLTSFLKAL